MIKLNFYNKLYDISLCEPTMIKAKLDPTEIEYHYFTLNKESYNLFYKFIGVKLSESKAIFKADEKYWEEFIKKQMETFKFNFEDYSFIVAGDDLIVSIKLIDLAPLKLAYDKLIENLNNLDNNSAILSKHTFDLDTYSEKMVINTGKTNEYETIVLLENDYLNSSYTVSSGLYIDKLMWLHNSKSISEKTILNLLSKINLKDEIDLSVKFGEAIYKDYKFDSTFLSEINLSLNELFTLLRKIGVNIEVNKDKQDDDFGLATELVGLPEGNLIADKILDNINGFDIPVKPLMRLQALKKSFKDSKISFKDILLLLTMEYFNIRLNIKIDTLMSIKSQLTKHSNDATIIKDEVNKIINGTK